MPEDTAPKASSGETFEEFEREALRRYPPSLWPPLRPPTSSPEGSEPPPSDEIEITPEMIEAGASVLMGFETYFSDEEIWAERVYRAMAAASAQERERSKKARDALD